MNNVEISDTLKLLASEFPVGSIIRRNWIDDPIEGSGVVAHSDLYCQDKKIWMKHEGVIYNIYLKKFYIVIRWNDDPRNGQVRGTQSPDKIDIIKRAVKRIYTILDSGEWGFMEV